MTPARSSGGRPEAKARPFREGSYGVGQAQELGHLPRERDRDLTLEAGLSLAKVGLEEAEGEEVAVPGGPPGLSEEEVKECLLLQQTGLRLKKGGHHSSPFSPVRRFGEGRDT